MKKNKGMSGRGIAAAAAGAVAIGAGAYYLLGPNAKAHQKKTKTLFIKMKKEVISKIKKVQKVTPQLYHQAIDTVSKNYTEQYKLHEKDIKAFAKKMKTEWKDVAKKAIKKSATSFKKKRA